MAVNTPTWLIGRDCSLMRVTTQDRNLTTGAFSAGTAYSIAAFIDGVEVDQTAITANITPITSPRENEVVIETGATMSVVEILKLGPGPTDPNSLVAIWKTARSLGQPWGLFEFTRGGDAWSMYGMIAGYTREIRKGKCTDRLELTIVDVLENTGGVYSESPNPNLA